MPIVGIYRGREVAERAARARPWRGWADERKGKVSTASCRRRPGDAQRLAGAEIGLRKRSISSSNHRGTRGTSTTRTTATRLWTVLERV